MLDARYGMSTGAFRVVAEYDLEMTARDGTVLRADVYRPDAPGRFPVLLLRTPYGKRARGGQAQNEEIEHFPQLGYVVVIQDTRGRGVSDGEYYPFLREGPDGYDSIEWAAALPWSTGKVGTIGQSYLASVQYAVAGLAPPSLAAMNPVAGGASHFLTSVYRRGVFELRWRLAYFLGMERISYHRAGTYRQHRDRLDSYVSSPGGALSMLTDEAYRHLPVKDWGDRLRGQQAYLADFMAHSVDSPFWSEGDIRAGFDRVRAPMLHVGSWYDAFQADTLDVFSGLRAGAATEGARANQRLVMGPWAHLRPYSVPTTAGTGDIDFGPEAAIELFEIHWQWFDHWLKGHATPLDDQPPVRIFVMGVNRWRDEDSWPLARAVERRAHLRSGGRLSWEAPTGDEEPDTYIYDPEDPLPTLGGPFIGDDGGVRDQRPRWSRPDVLAYVTDPLPEALEVTGPVIVELWAASSAVDTDFTATLVDVHPDGFAQNVVDGIVRARFRDSLASPSPLEPGRPYGYTIDLRSTSHVVLAGHRLAVFVSSSDFPRYDRNANSGLPFGEDTSTRTAAQTVFHDGPRPSAVVLPVVCR